MKINKAGLDLIKRSEGLELSTYICSGGAKTIGYGSTRNVTEGMTITEEEADELLRQDVEYFEEKVSELVTVPLTSNQFSALVSFTFNLGESALGSSTLLKLLNAGDYLGAADQLLRWDKAGDVRLPGLTRRRIAERELFLTEDEEVKLSSLESYRKRFEAVVTTHHTLVKDLIDEIERLENS